MMAIRWCVYSLLLFASWYFNLLGLPDAVHWSRCEPRCGYLATESHLVVYRLVRPDVSLLHPLFCESPDGPKPYRSQFGAQGIVLSALCRLTAADPAVFANVAAAVFAMLTAIVVAGIFVTAQRDLGPPVGDIACTLATFAPVFVKFAPSLYWVTFLLLLPFALVWCFGPHATTTGRRVLMMTGVGAAIYCKALCGYEYITTVIVAPVAASWFHQHRVQMSLGRKIGTAVVLLSVGMGAFALAMVTHIVQVETVFGEDGIAAIRDRAVARTAGTIGGEQPGGDSTGTGLTFAATCFGEYFGQRALATPAMFGRWAKDVSLIFVVGAAGAFVLVAAIFRKRLLPNIVALAGAIVFALVAAVSWQVLAVNHMCVHRHLNLIVFAVPFLPLMFVLAGYGFRRCHQRIGPIVLGLVPLLIVANLVNSRVLAESGATDQQKAEATIADVLPRLTQIENPEVIGSLDSVRPMSAVPPAMLVEWGLLDLNTGLPADPNAVVITGWAMAGWKPTQRPLARVVTATGNRVVPNRIQWYRRTDMDALLGWPAHRIAFVLVIPSAEVDANQRLRVLAVSASEPTRVTELPLK